MALPKNNSYDDALGLKAERIAYLIRDYENYPYFGPHGAAHVLRWVNQFDEKDRVFLLSELSFILPKCYLTKQNVVEEVSELFTYFKSHFDIPTIDDFIDQSCFLKCQSKHKSQTEILSFVEEILETNYARKIQTLEEGAKNMWIYIDDVIATGGTFKRDIVSVIRNYGLDKFISENITLIAIFFFDHTWGSFNSIKNINRELGEGVDISNQIKLFYVRAIQNIPYKNQSYNHVYPVKENQPKEVFEYLESLKAQYYENYAFRPIGKPDTETFFSSPESRTRYENILLLKGIDLISRCENGVNSNVRPLGIVSPGYKTFGLGSHAFTWRNISNTCPLVFWWEVNGWYPLFHVKNRGL